METSTLGRTIAARRKALGLTQEQLATALGVTNQSVSKWEGGLCCPDIQLLPDLADRLDMTIDQLLGHSTATTPERLCAYLRTLSKAELAPAVLSFAQEMHTQVLLHSMDATGLPDRADSLARAHKPWGYSCCSMADIITVRSGSALLFADPAATPMDADTLHSVAYLLRQLADPQALSVLTALYRLCGGNEERSAALADIAAEAQLPPQRAAEVLQGPLVPLLTIRGGAWSIKGMYMHLTPLLSLVTQD